ncbi:MAG: cold shock domain-containing protein, partial [Pseudomonadota bacterium]
ALIAVGRAVEAKELFLYIREKAPEDFRPARQPRSSLISRLIPKQNGLVHNKEGTFCFIKSAVYPDDIFSHETQSSGEVWDEISSGREVRFELEFDRTGPQAVQLETI